MDLIFCILLSLTQLRISYQIDLPDRLSEILDKLIEASENKDYGKSNTNKTPKTSNESRIIYVKAKSDPNVSWKVKYDNITDIKIDDLQEKVNVFEDTVGFDYHETFNQVGYVDAQNPEEVTKLKSKLSDKKHHNGFPHEHGEIISLDRSGIIEDETSYNKYSPKVIDNNKFSQSFLSNITKLLKSKKYDDDSIAFNLNKNYEKLLKEIHDIKELHRKDNLKSNDKTFLIQPPSQHHKIALKPIPYIPILLNYHLISNIDVLPRNPVTQTPYYKRYSPISKHKLFSNNYKNPVTILSRITPKSTNTHSCKSCN